jgi:hypothetical protein
MLGNQQGSASLDLFFDPVDSHEQDLKAVWNTLETHLAHQKYTLTVESTLKEFLQGSRQSQYPLDEYTAKLMFITN